MDNNSNIPMLFPVDPEQFWTRIRQIIGEEIKAALPDGKEVSLTTEEPLMTRKEIAAYLKISLVTLNDWTKNRGLPKHRKRGGVRFLKSEVLDWLKKRD
jgi:excisionase family DNA binding protein